MFGFLTQFLSCNKPQKDIVTPIESEPAPCGNQQVHDYWMAEGWACPVCRGQAARIREQREREVFAKLVALELFKLQQNATHNNDEP